MKQTKLEQLMQSYKYSRTMETQYGQQANKKEKCILCIRTRLRKDCVGCGLAA